MHAVYLLPPDPLLQHIRPEAPLDQGPALLDGPHLQQLHRQAVWGLEVALDAVNLQGINKCEV